MNRISPLLTAGVVALTMLAVPTLAAGAVPKKGSSYAGTLYASGELALTKKVVIKVSSTGTGARTTFGGSQRPANWISFAIKKDGSFKAFSNTGSLTVWSIVGRFVTAGKVVAVLHLNATCDGKGGRFVATLCLIEDDSPHVSGPRPRPNKRRRRFRGGRPWRKTRFRSCRDSSDAPMASEIRARVAVTEGERASPVDGREHPSTTSRCGASGLARRDGLHWPHCDGLKWPHLSSGFCVF